MTDKFDASDQIVNSKSDLANMVRILTMQRDKLAEEVEDWKANYNKATDACVALRAENERLRYLLKAAEDACRANMQEVERLRVALEKISKFDASRGDEETGMGDIARAALQSKQGE